MHSLLVKLNDRQKVCYGQRPIRTLDKGYLTAALASDELRAHLIHHLEGITRPETTALLPGGGR